MIEHNFNLVNVNTFGIAAQAAHYYRIDALDDLAGLRDLKAPLFYLGGGSNVLFTEDYSGTVVHNCMRGIEIIEENDASVLVKAYAGEPWHPFVAHTLSQGWHGLECLAYIPGQVGATPVQNIGAYGIEACQFIERVHVYNLNTQCFEAYGNDECAFAYRDSIFKSALKDRLIVSVDFRLSKSPHVYERFYPALQAHLHAHGIDEPASLDIFNAVIAVRRSKLPEVSELGSAGSFFKNPVVDLAKAEALKAQYPDLVVYPYGEQCKLSAGQLIDRLGFKGQYANNVGMYEKQALILVNLGGATGQALYAHSVKVMQAVETAFGICLEPEVIIL